MCVFVCSPRALPGMMQWIRSQRPGESGINIITADFVELGEFISAVITLNYHLDDDEDDATWEPAGVQHGAQSLPPVLWSVLSLFSLWHLFKEGSCTASFTLFRAIVDQEIKWQKVDEGREVWMRRNNTGVWLEHEEESGFVCFPFGDENCFLKWNVNFLYFLCCKNNCFSTHPMHLGA